MPSIGPLEILMVSVIALLVFGPQRLPEIARTVGKTIAEFKRQANDIRSEFQTGLTDDDVDDEPTGLEEPKEVDESKDLDEPGDLNEHPGSDGKPAD